MKIKILTLFPEMFESVLSASILGRAVKAGLIQIELVNIRDYARNRHRNTDDYPFGGGAGMVMLPQPVVDAIEANQEAGMRRIYMSPRGRTLNQRIVEEYAKCDSLLFLCGHYEGVDQRALDLCIDEELSIGDYVLTGGELGALVAVDAVARLIPGVLGSGESSEDESFTTGLLEYPQYTRPAEFRGLKAPEVLLNGVHADIAAWRRRQSLEITRARRPELLESAPLDEGDRETLHRIELAESMLTELAASGVRAARMEMFRERGYARAWIERFVPAESRRTARKRYVSGRGHVGYLYQAFEAGMAPCLRGEAAKAALAEVRGAAELYLDREGVGFDVENCEALSGLRRGAVLSAADGRWTAAMGKGEMYFLDVDATSF